MRLFAHGDHHRAKRNPSHQGEEARRYENKKEAVNEALSEYIQRREQLKITEMFGKVDFDEAYDYKGQRKVR